MENIIIKAKNSTYIAPAVSFDAEKGILELEGDSYLEATPEFYNPLIDWIEQFTKEFNSKIIFNFKIKYFNTSSSGYFLDILLLLKDYKDNGNELDINWFFVEEDPDLEEEIEDYELDTDLSINRIYLEQK